MKLKIITMYDSDKLEELFNHFAKDKIIRQAHLRDAKFDCIELMILYDEKKKGKP